MQNLFPCSRWVSPCGEISTLNRTQEESEFRSDGTNKVLRPARLSLARVSVLRGDGPRQGVPFIDDHIHTSEVIVDYLTEFSGIKCKLLPSPGHETDSRDH